MLGFSSASHMVTEGDESVGLTIARLSGNSYRTISFYLLYSPGTANGKYAHLDLVRRAMNINFSFLLPSMLLLMTEGDYSSDGPVYSVLQPGETSVTVEVPIVNDGEVEDKETFTVSFSHISGYEVHPDFSTATVTIIDDDCKSHEKMNE